MLTYQGDIQGLLVYSHLWWQPDCTKLCAAFDSRKGPCTAGGLVPEAQGSNGITTGPLRGIMRGFKVSYEPLSKGAEVKEWKWGQQGWAQQGLNKVGRG